MIILLLVSNLKRRVKAMDYVELSLDYGKHSS